MFVATMFIPVSWLLTADLSQLFHNSRSICQEEAVAAQGGNLAWHLVDCYVMV
ncbi:TPA: hypothetical protein ACH53O_005037 [Escherichia coli]|uniref:hypothetical protein n=1 Tax=Escherichia coli TaxID=562 RepID=UPI000B270D91|nr:hypothetical protein [Escherichia coli]EEZ9764825.1 hypothetical protein [Escherichia coli O115]AYU70125.1 hypothetical protein D0378_00146 [Escherichia coli]EER3122258.1 hypothetical protein [Escherichia coli]EEU1877515.1 hypothetical protein [Escherichia coli]EEZ5531175.1 hypothetical protein [Escherichia coli]